MLDAMEMSDALSFSQNRFNGNHFRPKLPFQTGGERIWKTSTFGNSGTFRGWGISSGMNDTGCRALTHDECDKIIAAFDGRHRLRNIAMFTVGIKTGFRISEILSLQVRDVWTGGAMRESVTVAAAFMKGKKKPRSMPLNPTAKNSIMAYLRATRMDTPLFQNFPLFPAQGSRNAITPRQALSVITHAAERASVRLDHLATHSMRKTFASNLYHHPSIAGDLVKLSKVLCHSNPANTVRYVQFLDDSLERAILSI